MSRPRGFEALGLAVVAALCVGPIVDTDLGFHLATARAVLASGTIPATNVLSFASPGSVAVNQQWLPAVIFELAWRALGPPGVVAVRTVVVVATFAVVVATARTLGAKAEHAAVAAVLAASAAAFRFLDRPLLFSNLTNAVLVLGLAYDVRGRTRLGLGLVAGASVIGPQLHAGAIFGPLAALVWCGAGLLPARITGVLGLAPRERPVADVLRPLVASLLGVLGALVLLAAYHPHPLRVLLVPFQMGADPFLHEHLVEYRVPWDQPLPLLAPYWALLVATLAAVVVVARGGSTTSGSARLPPGVAAVAALGLVLSLAYARFVDLAAIFGAPFLALALGAMPALASRTTTGIAVLALALRVVVVPPAAPELSPATWPLALDGVIRSEHLVGPAFVQDGWAGPFLGLHYPDERVFFHPAFDAYPPGFYRDPYLSTRDGDDGWDGVLDRFGVELVLLKYTSERERARQDGRPNLRQLLCASPAWALVAFDDLGSLFVRRLGRNADAARRLAIDGVDPDGLALAGDHAAVLADLDALAARGLPSRRLELLRAAARE